MFDSYTLKLMVKEHGQPVTLRKTNEGSFNPLTGKLVTTTYTDYSVKAYFFDFESEAIDGQSILRSDRRVVIPTILLNGNATPSPNATDKIVGVDDTVDIISVERITSAGAVMCYLLHVRG
jgi:hypothetical protein